MKGLYSALFASTALLVSPAFGAAITDVTYEGAFADAAAGEFGGNDEVNAVNALGGAFAGDPWTLLDKTDDNGTTFMGVDFTLTAGDNDWVLAWTGNVAPFMMDFVFVTKAATSWAAYLFDDVAFGTGPDSGNGTYVITWLNGGNQIPDLSHGSIYGRASDDVPTDVPEPSTLMLLSLGLLGLRRRFSK